ncbi:hypothetical protein P1X15_20260 [Runella sp. MFBS21]|uniref:hypothetical protein n=1 Tax=Runella sp. MFBS21 TaxID=3034018 RepID=UPI0023F8F095|nr:hypothetical protein [Runella sp. MFBS21]MDF7819965.1 hypothetical protein [Runella sp. MFBS21]
MGKNHHGIEVHRHSDLYPVFIQTSNRNLAGPPFGVCSMQHTDSFILKLGNACMSLSVVLIPASELAD